MLRYVLYARKSSESEDRQVLSIDSQVKELQEFARARDLNVVQVLSESQSAKAPGRPVFLSMLRLLKSAKADAILCWKLDRLARNALDGGDLIYALDLGKLKAIATPQMIFSNTGNDKFWMQLEFGMAQKYVDDLSENVKRGNRAKLEQGWLPGVAPIGYLNDRVTKTIISDPIRFPLLRRGWDEALAGAAPSRILLNAQASGLTSVPFRRMGGNPISRSALYKVLTNPFYYGLIVRNGMAYRGAHEPMITKDEFDQVQERLGRPNRTARQKHEFAFTGLIFCGECGCSITAEHQINRQGHHYVYYRCSKKRTGSPCRQPTIRLEDLENQFAKALRSVAISDEMHRWAIAHLDEVSRRETTARHSSDRSLHETLTDCVQRIRKLTAMALRGLISDNEFKEMRGELVEEELRIRERIALQSNPHETSFEEAAKVLTFAQKAERRFTKGRLSEKRMIVLALGSNLILRDRQLQVSFRKPFDLLARRTPKTSWLAIVDGVRQCLLDHELTLFKEFTVLEGTKVVQDGL